MIEWRDVHAHLETARRAIERGHSPGPEETLRILKARARALARQSSAAQEPQEILEVIEFVLAYETYAVESRFVREIHQLKDLTPLPCAPAHVLGIVNVRGRILSVIDLKRFFELPEKGLTDLNKVVILQSESMEFGILADLIVGTRMISEGEIQASLPTLIGIREQYLKGVSAERSVILDAEKLLSDSRIVVHERTNE